MPQAAGARAGLAEAGGRRLGAWAWTMTGSPAGAERGRRGTAGSRGPGPALTREGPGDANVAGPAPQCGQSAAARSSCRET